MIYFVLCIKISYGFRRPGMQHDVCKTFILLFYGQLLLNKYLGVTVTCLLCVLYCLDRFMVGLGLL